MPDDDTLPDGSQGSEGILSDPEERRVWYAALDSFRYVFTRTIHLRGSAGLRCQKLLLLRVPFMSWISDYAL